MHFLIHLQVNLNFLVVFVWKLELELTDEYLMIFEFETDKRSKSRQINMREFPVEEHWIPKVNATAMHAFDEGL